MATRPTPGGSDGTWGTKLNAHLAVSLATDGKVLDGAVFSTSAAPTVDAGVSNKKYVDDQDTTTIATRAFGTPAADDDESNAMIKDHVYLANQDGTVTAFSDANNSATPLLGFIGSTSNPTIPIAGSLAATGAGEASVTFPVKSGWFFKITSSDLSVTTQNIYWHPIGTLVKTSDQT